MPHSLIALGAFYQTSSTLFLAMQNPYADEAKYQPLVGSSPLQSPDSRAPPNPCIHIVHPPNRSSRSLPCTFRWGKGSYPPCSRSPRRVPSRSAASEKRYRLATSGKDRECPIINDNSQAQQSTPNTWNRGSGLADPAEQ
jgi:hypothetical protein